MKAQIHLFFNEDNSFRAISEGSAIDFGMMLHKFGSDSVEKKAAILIAASALLKHEDERTSKKIMKKVEENLCN